MVGGKGGSNLVQFAQLINRLIEETRDLPLPRWSSTCSRPAA